MERFNTFESKIDDILIKEAGLKNIAGEFIDTAQKMATKITGTDLLGSTGIITNKYDPQKGYYPNIQKGARKFFNRGDADELQDASQRVIDELNRLKTLGEKLEDPTAPIPDELSSYVTQKFSQNFISNIINEFNQSINETEQTLNSLQGAPTPTLNNLITSIQAFRDDRSTTQYNEVYKQAKAFIRELKSNPAGKFRLSSLSFTQKSYFINISENFKDTLERWKVLMKSSKLANTTAVDTVPPIGESYINNDGIIYRDMWNDFLDNMARAIVGSIQRGWASSPNTYNLLVGEQKARYTGRGGLAYKEVKVIPPNTIKKFHEDFMIKAFIKSNILIYCTHEQWKKIVEGGILYRGANFMGRQAFTAGQNAPKVSL
ncbi:MAG: hypothetical protein PHS54_00280 [Clostridia bacterium]|nr:hypothetical protein [Clostridia bacterium]